MMAPKLGGIRLLGGVNGGEQEKILKGVNNIRNWVGQMPKIIKAKKAVAGFKLRKGADIAILVTIRNKNILKTITETIIYTKMEENGKGKILNRNIRFGLKTVPILKDAGVSIDLLIEGKVENNRANYYKSQILIP